MTDRLQGSIAIVTGAESGIGRAIAIAFAREGADLVLAYLRDAKAADETARAVREAGRAAITVQCDHTRPDDVERLFSSAGDAFGPPDILVNSAGLDAPGDEVAEMDEETWEKMLKVDLFGPFLCCRALIRARRAEGGGGRIVNISSRSFLGGPNVAHYAASKGAVVALTRCLSLELAGDDILVNSVAPGVIDTDILKGWDDEERAKLASYQPVGRIGQPSDVANIVSMLASPRRLYRGIQCQNIGLERNAFDHLDNALNFFGVLVDRLHGGNKLSDHFIALLRFVRHVGGRAIYMRGAFCVLIHRRGELLKASSHLLKR